MSRVFKSLVAVLAVSAVLSGPGWAQDSYTIGFTGPNALSGNEGAVVSAEFTCTLSHTGPGPGAQGWSLGITADNGKITAVNIAGTDAAALFSGGFEKSELTPVDPVAKPSVGDCAGRDGAVSAVVLSFTLPIVLPPNSTGSTAKVTLETTIAEGGTSTLRYVNGCRGSGQAVDNNVTQEGNSVLPTFAAKEVDHLIIVDCCVPAALNYGFSASAVRAGPPNTYADSSDTCAALGEVRITPGGPGDVYCNISSDGQDPAVQGWSLSIPYDGDGDIVGATTEGTAGAPVPGGLQNGGFEKTELIDPARNNNQRGCVSAIVLSFTLPITLPATGTESVLKVQVQGADGENARLSLRDGLRGSGQPVNNVITVGGGSGAACNMATAEALIAFRPPPGKGPFTRGDPNADNRINIADGIWIINELFRQGPATRCQSAADINNDGMMDLADATYIFDYQFFGGSAPPAPFPGCGVEPFEDELPCEDTSACP
jgi:hypothetical protein